MTRDQAVNTIRAFLTVSLNVADHYPVTVEPEPGKTGDWRFRVLPEDPWSFLKPSSHITWNGTNWRKPVAVTHADRVNDPTAVHMETVRPSPPPRPTEAELRAIVSNFLRTQWMTGFAFTLHDITDNSARFSGPEGGNPVRPVWSGKVTWTTIGRCGGALFIDSKVEFDKPTEPVKPVPDLAATDLGPFYAAKVKAEAAHADHVASLERAHRANMEDIDAALKQLKAPAQPSTSPLARLKDTIAEHEAWSMRRGSTDTVPPDWPTLRQSQDAILDAAHELCAAWKRR